MPIYMQIYISIYIYILNKKKVTAILVFAVIPPLHRQRKFFSGSYEGSLYVGGLNCSCNVCVMSWSVLLKYCRRELW